MAQERPEGESSEPGSAADPEAGAAAEGAPAAAPARGAQRARDAKARTAARRPAPPPEEEEEDDDEDDDDDTDTDEDTDDDEDTEAEDARARPARRPAPARGGAGAVDEEALDSPTRQSLGMIAVMAVAVVGMSLFAKRSCNVHSGGEAKKPREVTTSQLAATPRSAALELALRWGSWDFRGAEELAGPAVAEQIRADGRRCDGNSAECERQHAALKDRPLASAVLLTRDASSAVVRVAMREGIGGGSTYLLRLAPEGPIWKVIERKVDDGTFVPPPRQLVPIPAASGLPGAPASAGPGPVVPLAPAPAASEPAPGPAGSGAPTPG